MSERDLEQKNGKIAKTGKGAKLLKAFMNLCTIFSVKLNQKAINVKNRISMANNELIRSENY